MRWPGSRTAAPYLLAVAAVGASILALLPRPPERPPPPQADSVILVGVAGLRWGDVTVGDTPALWGLARQGAVGTLSVRSANRITCPADGWVTLGAGTRARRVTTPVDKSCPPVAVEVEPASGGGAVVADQREVVQHNRELAWNTQPGALAEEVGCTTALGPGAAIAAARPFGRIDRYSATLPDGEPDLFARCPLSVVDAGVVAGVGQRRRAEARAADAVLARVLASRPPRSLVMVVGLSDTGVAAQLHVAVAQGPGFDRGWLASATPGRPGYLQLVDVAPTALTALGRPIPRQLFSGAVTTRVEGRPLRLAEAVERMADTDRQGGVQRVVAGRFLLALALGQLLLFALLVPVLRRARHPVGDASGGGLSPRVLLAAEVSLVAAALAVPAALVADLVPWWRADPASPVFVAVTALVLAAATGVVTALTRRRRAVVPIGVAAAVAAVAVSIDVLTGSRLQLNGIAGYSAATSGRYQGLGTIGLGVLTGGLLLAAATVATVVPRRWRMSVMALAGAVGVVLVGSPYLGADAAGAVALSAGGCLAAVAASGGWVTTARVLGAGLTGVLVTTVFALLDLTRPVALRSNVGRLLVDLSDEPGVGDGVLAEERLGAHNITTMATSPLSLLVVGATVFAVFVLLRPTGGLRRLLGLHPAFRAGVGGVAVATLAAGLVEGVGFNVLGAAAATVVPLVTLGALRVMVRASERSGDAGRVGRTPDRGDILDVAESP